MRKVILLFPDITSLSEFILTYKVSRVIISTTDKMLRGTISEQHLHIACKQYGAKVKESVMVKNSASI